MTANCKLSVYSDLLQRISPINWELLVLVLSIQVFSSISRQCALTFIFLNFCDIWIGKVSLLRIISHESAEGNVSLILLMVVGAYSLHHDI
ncbi:hypothetical protein EB796_017613 [Bugula neritina]|uniref:Uncharacterized protein n=1 Tax=Bugula neritina TaxID=10212 RepID=A0A7J7JCS7_BUGNE|nr:hypothetical protein EB796_017613 [Bugula neritina]